MNVDANTITMDDLVQRCAAAPTRLMWFLGAGASRTANMPTASDLVWELKLRQFCREQNQDIRQHDVANRQIRNRIQSYFDSKGAPEAYADAEYSFYFEQAFGADYAAQQQFLQEQLNSEKISLNVGHRVLASMMAMGAARAVFTTNFDDVLETGMTAVAGKPLTAFNLEGSYAALDALNAENFPLYAKLHGDFRYRSIKNLATDLRENDAAIARAFIAAANRFGMVVTGYSGRDANVMRMFDEALNQSNPFSGGLFWAVTKASDVIPPVARFIEAARAKGVVASIVEVGTFDILMNRLWRQLPDRPQELVDKVRPDHAAHVAIPLPRAGNGYPLLRTNALPIISLPNGCGHFVTTRQMTHERLREAQGTVIPQSVIALTDGVLFWGDSREVEGFIPAEEIGARNRLGFDDPIADISASTILKGFFEHGLAKALCADKPVALRLRGRTHCAVASRSKHHAVQLEGLAHAVTGNRRGAIFGMVPKLDAEWTEAVSIHLDVRNGAAYLMLRPMIWIKPLSMREAATDFIRARELKRYNPQANALLSAWIKVLLGNVGRGENSTVTAFSAGDYPVGFTINAQTAFSRTELQNAG